MPHKHILEKDILTTLVYWDVFSFPLTAFEAWQYRISSARLGGKEDTAQSVSFVEVADALSVLTSKGLVAQKDGMFFLRGREGLASRRRRRGKVSDRKLRVLRRIVKVLRFVPFVRMVGVTGRLSYKNIGKESDWDVLIILKSGRMWIGRTLVTGLLHLMGRRRHGKYEKDRVCLNHFLADRSLEIGLKDLFAAREYTLILPLFGWETFQAFEKKNDWIREFLPEWRGASVPPLLFAESAPWIGATQHALEQACNFDFLETLLKTWQTKKIAANPKSRLPQGFIRATDEALIFLPDPQGPKVFEQFMERLGSLRR